MSSSNSSKRLPVWFVSHGAPTLFYEKGNPIQKEFKALSKRLKGVKDEIKALLFVSAHFEESSLQATSAEEYGGLFYDYYGFPSEMYEAEYDAPGSPELAQRVQELLGAAGLKVALNEERKLDHGVFSPAMLMFPEAKLPIVEVSLVRGKDAKFHHGLGEALQPLREEGILIVCSGSTVHNLREITWGAGVESQPRTDWAREFDEWVIETNTSEDTEGRKEGLVAWKDQEHASKSHPTDEHFLPLVVASGAAGTSVGSTMISERYQFGSLPYTCFEFVDVEGVE